MAQNGRWGRDSGSKASKNKKIICKDMPCPIHLPSPALLHARRRWTRSSTHATSHRGSGRPGLHCRGPSHQRTQHGRPAYVCAYLSSIGFRRNGKDRPSDTLSFPCKKSTHLRGRPAISARIGPCRSLCLERFFFSLVKTVERWKARFKGRLSVSRR